MLEDYCQICKKEIKPGQKMIILAVRPSKGKELSMRLWHAQGVGWVDNAPKYHEECYLKKYVKQKKDKL